MTSSESHVELSGCGKEKNTSSQPGVPEFHLVSSVVWGAQPTFFHIFFQKQTKPPGGGRFWASAQMLQPEALQPYRQLASAGGVPWRLLRAVQFAAANVAL